MEWAATLAAELPRSMSDPRIWAGITEALLLALGAMVLGHFVAKRAGLVADDATAGEAAAVGLAIGLSLIAALTAAVGSAGQSAFTPVAIAFAVAVVIAVVRPSRAIVAGAIPPGGRSYKNWLLVAGGSATFLAAAVILYGSTVALMQRDDVQPLEFFDEAFYAVLGRDVVSTGREWLFSPSGFAALPGTPDQTWYHWGEVWLTGLVARALDTNVIDARHFVVLPVLLLAAAGLSGSIVRSFGGTRSTGAYVFGFVCCLFLAPIPLFATPWHAVWAVGLAFGVTVYGSAAVAGLLVLHLLAASRPRTSAWASTALVGTMIAFLVPAHLIVAALGLIGVCFGAVWTAVTTLRRGGRLRIGAATVWVGAWALAVIGVTAIWGLATGHGIGASSPSAGISPFDEAWRETIVAVLVGSAVLLAAPLGIVVYGDSNSRLAGICAGTCGLVVAGAVAWGLRFADFNMFHVFFAGLTVFLTPVSAGVAWTTWLRFRSSGRRRLAVALAIACVFQLEFAGAATILRLQRFGPGDYPPIPIPVLDAIRSLPDGAKVAYACQPLEEHSVWDPRLVAIDGHTGRRMVSMCFQADALAYLIGGTLDPTVESPFFQYAPQHTLYPEADSVPTQDEILRFMRDHGIEYVYSDSIDVSPLVHDTKEIIQVGNARLSRIPEGP